MNKNSIFPILVPISVALGSILVIYNFHDSLLSLITFFVENFSSILSGLFWYLFVFVNLLIPQIIVLGFLAYKSKPSDESFKVFFDKICTFGSVENQPSENSSIFQKILMMQTNYVIKKSIQAIANTIVFDACVVKIAYIILPNDSGKKKESHIFIGVFGAWIPYK